MASSLASKLIKAAGKSDTISVMSESKFKTHPIIFSSPIAAANVMFSGDIKGGLTSGITQILGDSRVFKSGFCLAQVKAFLDAKPDGICLFFDSEFGSGDLIKSLSIDEERVIHIPFVTVEELKIKMSRMLDEITLGEDVIIYVDSISQVASKKEVEDALEGKEVADLTRAKALNSLFRVITGTLAMKRIPMLVINSFYEDMGNKYAEVISKGGKQAKLSSSNILLVSRSQIKDDSSKELNGWSFNYTIMKSRSIKEKSKFYITVNYDGGIDVNSNLFEWAMECGIVYTEKQGFYKIRNLDGWESDKSWRRSALEKEPGFFDSLRDSIILNNYVKHKYLLESGSLISDESKEVTIDEETGEILS